MSRKKKNAKRRNARRSKKQLKKFLKLTTMADNEKLSFRDQCLNAISGGRAGTQPSTDQHVLELTKRLGGSGTNGNSSGYGPPTRPQTPMTQYQSEGEDWGGWHGYGAHGGGHSHSSGHSGTTSNYSQSPTPAGIVVLVDKEGKRTGFTFKITQGWKDWWRVASRFYIVEKDEMFIPADRVTLSYDKVRFNACVYQSSEDYITARWGRKLHHTDRDWLAEHPLATDGGVPAEYTPICVQGMLAPYEMGVSRIRMRRGTLAAGPELQKFMIALGCNPYAFADHTTTNKEAAEKLGITEEEANKVFRFEFADDPLPCSVVCEKGYAQSGVTTGSQGGHARYLAPRDKFGEWVVSLQCAPLEQIEYNTPIILPEYVPRKGDATLTLEKVMQPAEDLPVGIKWQNDFYFHEELAEKLEKKKREEEERSARPHIKVQATVPDDRREGGQKTVVDVLVSTFRRSNGSVPGVTGTRPIQLLDGSGNPQPRNRFNLKHKCIKCEKQRAWSVFADNTEICEPCMDEAFKGYECPGCKYEFKGALVPEFISKGLVDGVLTATFQCQRRGCKEFVVIKQTDDPKANESLLAILGYLPLGDGLAFQAEIDEFIYHSEYSNFDSWWIAKHPDDIASVPDATGADTKLLETNTDSLSSETVLIH